MNNTKKTILILIDWYLPGRKAGGPVKSIESLVWALGNEFNFKILTTDTDLGSEFPYKEVESNKWMQRKDGSEIFYLQKYNLSKKRLAEIINSVQHDFLYLNSFYSKWFSIVPLQLKKNGVIKSKIILAPRGMLSKGALALKSFKKKIFIRYSKLTGLHKGITWHATYEKEVREITNVYGDNAEIKLCANFSKPVLFVSEKRAKQGGELNLFYLSRVARVKNLHIALQSLKELNSDEKIIYDIYGSVEDENYFNECKAIIDTLPGNIKVEFKGELSNERVGEEIPKYHFLFLPTSNENFGHSIFESLQCGCPVIISNKTPWRNLEELNCGWDIEPQAKDYFAILERCLQMENVEYMKMSAASMKLAEVKINERGHKEAARLLFS